jgi:C4-dicarboxylate-specific signal transduction histidine kinase
VSEARDPAENQLFEEELPLARADLEVRLAERMADLARANAQLQQALAERAGAEKALRRCQEELAHVARLSSLGEMASGLAHELTQPLSAILTYTHGLAEALRAGESRPEELLPILERIAAQARHSSEVLHRLRDFVRHRELQRLDLAVNDLVREMLLLGEIELRASGARLHLDLAEALPTVRGDRVQLEQVLLNLVRNALEAMRSVALPDRLLTLRTAALPDGQVELVVTDSGPGFTPAQAQQLFEPFYSSKPEGLGMGLAISRSIIEAHGGRVEAESRASGGATFRVTLPAAPGT